MLRILTLATATAIGLVGSANAEWDPDLAHTAVMFEVDHLGFSTVVGRFSDVDVTFDFDETAPEETSVTAEIDAASIDSGFGPRDEHLRSGDFFNVEEHPTITFESESLDVTGDDTAQLHGELTLLGETNDVTLDVVLNNLGANPFGGPDVAGFSASGTIDRTDYGMDFGTPAIGQDILIRIEFEATRAEDSE